MCYVTELEATERKKANPLMLFKIRRDFVIIEALCVSAAPSSLILIEAKLVPVHLHMAPICCLIKECLPPQLL